MIIDCAGGIRSGADEGDTRRGSGEHQNSTAHLGESWIARFPPYPIIPTPKGTFEPDGPFYESLPAGTHPVESHESLAAGTR